MNKTKGFRWPLPNKEIVNIRQKRIRDLEWNYVEKEVKNKKGVFGTFLDVGCGTGYTLSKARKLGFSAIGIEPEIGKDGVTVRIDSIQNLNELIQVGVAEYLPFKNDEFDIVYSSHSLEHFQDRNLGLTEMSRVLKPNGIAVIVVPTGTMVFVRLISEFMFTTHLRIGSFIIKQRSLESLKQIFFLKAHGSYASLAIHEINDFSIKNWRKIISMHFQIVKVILPGLYPFPDFPQFFPFIKSKKKSSSVIFICKKFR